MCCAALSHHELSATSAACMSFTASVPLSRRQAAHAAQQPASRRWDASSDQALRMRSRHRLHACCAARHEPAVQSDSQPGALPVAHAAHVVRSSTALVQADSMHLTTAAGHSLTS